MGADNPIMESVMMGNEVLSQMQASLEDSDADISQFSEFISQNDDLMDINDATDQELEDLISNDVTYQARFDEVRIIQEQNIVFPTMIMNSQHVAAIMQNAGIRFGEEEFLVELHDGVSSFSPTNEVNNENQFLFSRMMNDGIIY